MKFKEWLRPLRNYSNYDLHWGEHVLLGQATTHEFVGIRVWTPHVKGWNMEKRHQALVEDPQSQHTGYYLEDIYFNPIWLHQLSKT